MARKNKSSDEAVSLDSLMDALTNVVAVLILVLILVQADVTQKVIKFVEDVEPATQEQVDQSKEKIKDLTAKVQSLEKKEKEDPPPPEKIEQEKRNIFLLEKSIADNTSLLANLNELKNLRIELQKQKDQESLVNTKIQEEIAKLEAQLDQTPILDAPLPTVVTIPKSRPLPENSNIYQALVIANRVHMINTFPVLDMFEKELKTHRRDWEIEKIKQQGKDRFIYDPIKVAEHFKTFDFKNAEKQKIELLSNPTWKFKQIRIQPDLVKGGTPVEELGKPGTEFSKLVSIIKNDKKSVIIFYVNSDSFNAYLKARSLIDSVEIPAGWEMWGGKEWTFRIPDFEVKQLEIPPPAKPKDKGDVPPTLGTKLD